MNSGRLAILAGSLFLSSAAATHAAPATVTGPNADIAFQRVDNFRPPTWPADAVPMQMHLDFFVDDLAATGARVLAAGATRFDFQPNSDHCFVYSDPAGHPFCLSTWDSPRVDDL